MSLSLTSIMLDDEPAIVAKAVADLFTATAGTNAAEPAPAKVVRIIARRIDWQDRMSRPDRSGMSRRWECSTEGGELLVSATGHPLADAAAVLLTKHNLPDDTPVTLRHSDKGYDSFRPMKLAIAAAPGIRRMEERSRLKLLSESKAGKRKGKASPAGEAARRSSHEPPAASE